LIPFLILVTKGNMLVTTLWEGCF